MAWLSQRKAETGNLNDSKKPNMTMSFLNRAIRGHTDSPKAVLPRVTKTLATEGTFMT